MLGALEADYRGRGEPVTVLGIHSAKFPAENDSQRVRDAVRRYGVQHPVLIDQKLRVCQSYGVRAWPTLVVLRPDATIAATLPGEPHPKVVEEIVDELLEESRRNDSLREPVRFDIQAIPPSRKLAYPGKAVATTRGLAIADSGNHRVVLLDRKGRIQQSIGNGEAGFTDGPSGDAQFQRPQGLAQQGATLFVADTGNHALRAIDLDSGDVTTAAGTGHLGREVPQDLTPAREVSLRSPWDIASINGILLIAMAGAHQIWAYLPTEQTMVVFAGAGRESIDDGNFERATFAQPTGLSVEGQRVYVADSEASAVRVLDLDRADVETVVGKGLFVFGDRDGNRDEALLQHVQDVAAGPNGLLLADSFNDKIRRLDLETGMVSTWFESSGDIRLSEPSGLFQLEGGQVLVADTNNHRVLVISEGGATAKAIPAFDTKEKPEKRSNQ